MQENQTVSKFVLELIERRIAEITRKPVEDDMAMTPIREVSEGLDYSLQQVDNDEDVAKFKKEVVEALTDIDQVIANLQELREEVASFEDVE